MSGTDGGTEQATQPGRPAWGAMSNLAPVHVESTIVGPLEMEGAIPDGLEGLLVRNGPNAVPRPVPPAPSPLPEGSGAPSGSGSGGRWLDGDGMVHAVGLRGGAAVSYRNRWVRTRRLSMSLDTFMPTGAEEVLDSPANANVVWLGGQLLALSDCGMPHLLNRELRTLRVEDFGAMLESPVSAHPHTDAETGATALSGYDPFGPPYLRYHELDDSGQVVHSAEIDTSRCTAQPDFAASASRVAFFDMPAALVGGNRADAPDLAPAWGDGARFVWNPEAGGRLGVLDRGAPGSDVTWIEVEPCFVSHVVNAFDDGDRMVVDVCRYDAFDGDGIGHGGAGAPRLERWAIDVGRRHVDVTMLDDRLVELPRMDAVCAGRPYRYAYCVEFATGEVPDPVGLVRYDLMRDEATHRSLYGGQPGEPIFVRAPDGHADDEGWLLTMVYDPGRDASDLVILDASELHTAKVEAVIHLPVRVPFGLHGSWVPLSSYR